MTGSKKRDVSRCYDKEPLGGGEAYSTVSGPRGFQLRGCVDWDECEDTWPESLEVTLRGLECLAEALTLRGRSQGKVLSW